MSGGSRSVPSRAPSWRTPSSRTLPDRPSLRYLKLEAKRRLAAGEFPALHDAQAAIARELGLPNWAALKQACTRQESHALAHLRWIIARFSGADGPGWMAPGEDELRQHFDDRVLAALPPGYLVEQTAKMAADLRAELYADGVPDLVRLMGPVISCGGPRGTVRPSNGGYGVLGQLVADATGLPYARAAARLVLEPLGMRDSRFPARPADIGPGAVTGYTVTTDGAFEAFPAQVCTLQAVAGLWSTGADLVRLGTGWSSLLPGTLTREALTAQAEPGPGGLRVGLGWLLAPGGQTAAHGGTGPDAVAFLRGRVRDGRTHVVLTSRAIAVESIDRRLTSLLDESAKAAFFKERSP
jgi:Beta-lactamase